MLIIAQSKAIIQPFQICSQKRFFWGYPTAFSHTCKQIYEIVIDRSLSICVGNPNDANVPSPIEYKKANGSKQRTCFQTKKVALWSAVAIYRILKNEIYTGTLVQGKTTSPNHKVKKTVVKPQSEWARTENAHEPIITHAQFDLVQKLMLDVQSAGQS